MAIEFTAKDGVVYRVHVACSQSGVDYVDGRGRHPASTAERDFLDVLADISKYGNAIALKRSPRIIP